MIQKLKVFTSIILKKIKGFKRKDNVQLLVEILFDKTAREDERDDAAMYLGRYPSKKALNALLEVVSDPKEDFIIVDSAIESFAEICIKLNSFDESALKKMPPFAQRTVFEFIMDRNPSLISHELKEEFKQKQGI